MVCLNKYLKDFENDVAKLNLSANSIHKIDGLDDFIKLKYLDLSHNIIKKIEGLENLVNLTYLNLSHNQITKIEGLEKLNNLKYLGLFSNKIEKIENIMHLRRLEKFFHFCNPILYTPPNIQRFLDRMRNRENIYDNSQSVHDSDVQNSITKSIYNLLSNPNNFEEIFI